VSCDPIYRYSAAEIAARIDESCRAVLEQTRRNATEFVWNHDIPDIDALGRLRMNAMRRFLDDYEPGCAAGRYVAAELPTLPFADNQFDLAVCSHFLFLYSEQLTGELHVASIRELCRVSREARIFPLLELGSVNSRHVDFVAEALRCEGFRVDVVRVEYEFQRGGNEMMCVERPKGS
jgi:hypothetical protein